jgi:cell division protein FtsQ
VSGTGILRETLAQEAKVLPFRRAKGGVRVRRRRIWPALLGLVAQALAVVGAPVALAFWLLASPSFALARVEVEGNRHVDPAWVEKALAPMAGENLLRLSLPAVERVLAANPWVESVTISKRLPNRLHLAIAERRPAALLRTAQGLVVLDARGRTIAPYEPGRVEGDLLLVSVGAASSVDLAGAIAIADELRRAAPDWASSLSEVEALSEDDFRLYLGALPFPVAVRAGTLAARLPTLRALLPELERRYPAIDGVDLRFDRRIVFQPEAERS